MADPNQNSSRFRWTPFEMDCLAQLESRATTTGTSTSDSEMSDDALSEPTFSLTASLNSGASLSGPNGGGLWDSFETCAHRVAKCYRDSSWHSFQRAAQATTQLYKDSVEAQRRAFDQGLAHGRQKLLKELIVYLRSSQRSGPFIRREDLLAFLAGKSPPTRNSSSVHSHDYFSRNSSPTSSVRSDDVTGERPSALHMFQQALTLESGSTSPRNCGSPRSSPSRRVGGGQPRQELGTFLLEEVRRHRKRSRNEDLAAATALKRSRRM